MKSFYQNYLLIRLYLSSKRGYYFHSQLLALTRNTLYKTTFSCSHNLRPSCPGNYNLY